MSTTHVQSLPNVRGRMSYTEFGEGKRRREHLENGTDRIAAQMGDAASREDFIVYCEGQKHRHPNSPDDIQRGMEYAYTLCHELAPDSMCWVTMHVDGEGGCVHAHATIANHDARSGQVINKEDTSLYAPRVQAVNDRLSRENGFQVLGADKEMSAWAQRRDTFGYDSFDRHLGDKVAYARDRSDTVDEFKRNLELEGVTLKETVKTDKKTGEVTAGWSYKAVDEWGPKRRSRKRRASNLADDLTKEGVEAYFEEKQRQEQEQAAVQPEPATVQEPAPEQAVAAEPQPDSPAEPSFDVYAVEESDVAQMAGDLQRAHIDRSRGEASVRVPQEHVGRREAPEVSREGPCPRGRARGAGKARAPAGTRGQGGKVCRWPREVRGRCGQAVRVAEKDKGAARCCSLSCGSVDFRRGHVVPAGSEVGYAPDVQPQLRVVEHRLVGVLHEEARVLDDVPLEYLVPGRPIPAHRLQLAAGYLVGEHHAAAGLGQVGVGLDAVVTHRAPPLPPRCPRWRSRRTAAWSAGSRSRCSRRGCLRPAPPRPGRSRTATPSRCRCASAPGCAT